jgi:hypothetical protein
MRHQDGDTDDEGRDPTYDLPLIQKYLDRVSFLRYIPFCPALVTTTVVSYVRARASYISMTKVIVISALN